MNEKKYLHIGQRLEEERLRLGLNKTEMAALGGVANSAYGNYENGDRAPSGEYLAKAAIGGLDVQYVLTATRNSESFCLPEEMSLLISYRKAGSQKKLIREVAEAFANLEKGKE